MDSHKPNTDDKQLQNSYNRPNHMPIPKDPGKWKTLSSEYLFKRPWLTARRDVVELPNGVVNPEFYVLEYPDWINVIAITTDGKFVMERQYRHGLDEVGTELCAGVVEEGGPRRSCQARTLRGDRICRW